MKIGEVMEGTALTKKAINYYEEEGLIKPAVNLENNYREYTEEDVDKLVQISVLRQFDVPVKEVKEIIQKPEKLNEVLKHHLSRMEEEVKRLERSKSILKSCLNKFDKSHSQISEFTKELSLLNRSLEMDERSKDGFMRGQLQRIFPGKFGRMMMVSYSAFLNEPIDTEEKERAWDDLVKFLDETDSIEYSDEMCKLYETLPEEDMEKMISFQEANVKKWISITQKEREEEKNMIMNFYHDLDKNTDKQETWQKCFRMNKDLKGKMKNVDYYNKVNENLKILSSSYRTYSKNRADFYNSLNIKVDDAGNVTIE